MTEVRQIRKPPNQGQRWWFGWGNSSESHKDGFGIFFSVVSFSKIENTWKRVGISENIKC